MNTLVIVACVLAALMGLTMYAAWRQLRPKHVFVARDFNLGSVQPYRLKTLSGSFKVKRRDGKQVNFPIVPGYAQPRIDGKGVFVEGDLNTGQLIRPTMNPGVFEGSHGIYNAAALADGRVDLLVRSTKGSGLTLKHVMIALAVVGGLVCVVIYQFAKGHGSA